MDWRDWRDWRDWVDSELARLEAPGGIADGSWDRIRLGLVSAVDGIAVPLYS